MNLAVFPRAALKAYNSDAEVDNPYCVELACQDGFICKAEDVLSRNPHALIWAITFEVCKILQFAQLAPVVWTS